MPTYDATRFDPPAPVAYVTLRNPETGDTKANVPMILDSGSDTTLMPQAAINWLDLPIDPDKRYELMGFDGSRSVAVAVQAELLFAHRTFRGQFLLIDRNWGVIGRNVLNLIPLLLDGPRLQWDEYRPPN